MTRSREGNIPPRAELSQTLGFELARRGHFRGERKESLVFAAMSYRAYSPLTMTRIILCAAALLTFGCNPRRADESQTPGPIATMPASASTHGASGTESASTSGSSFPAPPPYEPTKPTTVQELLVVQQGAPEAWTLYDVTGEGPGSELFDVHVDGDGVYWAQKAGRLFSGSLDGTAKPKQIGRFQGTLGGDTIRSDDRYVYFVGGGVLSRWPKGGGACNDYSSCPEVLNTQLLFEHQGGPGPLAVDERFVYYATHGCAAVTRYDKERFEGTDIFVTLPSDGPGNGPTTLEVDGQDVYCAAWGSIFKLRWWDEDDARIDGTDSAVRLVTSQRRIWAMTLSEEHVYWAEYADVGDTISFGRLPRGGGTLEVIEPPAGVFSYAVSRRMLYDPVGRAVLFGASAMPTDATWMNPGLFIASLSTDDLSWRFYARELPTGYFAIDGQFLYWTSQQAGAVRRMPLDAEPLFTIEP